MVSIFSYSDQLLKLIDFPLYPLWATDCLFPYYAPKIIFNKHFLTNSIPTRFIIGQVIC